MMTTVILLSLLIFPIVLTSVFWCVFLALGLRWAKVTEFTKKRIAVCFGLVLVGNIVVQILSRLIDFETEPIPYEFQEPAADSPLIREFVLLLFLVGIQLSVISAMFKLDLKQTFKAWLPTLAPIAVIAAFILLVLRPFVFQMYVVPTNGMAPAIVGEHWIGTCSVCGGVVFGSPNEERRNIGIERWPTICEKYHLNTGELLPQETIGGDRIAVIKFLKPRRWDIIVFRFPQDPSVTHVKRLVGLPGEEVVIDDGSVWIDGQQMTPPDELAAIEYRFPFPDDERDAWGTVDRPAQLGDKEYFVLGDFSIRSLDSRNWDEPDFLRDESETPVASPYAVPESHLIGVVTHRYWPPSRWAIMR